MRVSCAAILLCFLPFEPRVEARPAGTTSPAAVGSQAREPSGSFVIVGGGLMPTVARDQFLQLAGGAKARIVVIPTASVRAHNTKVFKSYAYWNSQKVASVELLHTLDKTEANSPSFVEPLRKATGVWLAGGDQGRLTGIYRGTLVERALRDLLARGGVIGGTSAGASAMSAVMITGGKREASVGDGFGFLPAVVIDQHFTNRNRLQRLLGVLSKHPTCLGLGIDERTAVVVNVKDQTATVVGDAGVSLCLPPQGREQAKVQVFKKDQKIDLLALTKALLDQAKAAAPAAVKAAGAASRAAAN